MSRRCSFVDRASFLAIAAAAGAFGTVSAQDVLPRRLAAAAGEQHKKPTAEPPTLKISILAEVHYAKGVYSRRPTEMAAPVAAK